MWLEHEKPSPVLLGLHGAVDSHLWLLPHPIPLCLSPFPRAGLIYLPRGLAAPSGNADGCWAISGPGEAQLRWETNCVLLMGAGSEPLLLLPLLVSQGSSAVLIPSGLSWVCSLSPSEPPCVAIPAGNPHLGHLLDALWGCWRCWSSSWWPDVESHSAPRALGTV